MSIKTLRGSAPFISIFCLLALGIVHSGCSYETQNTSGYEVVDTDSVDTAAAFLGTPLFFILPTLTAIDLPTEPKPKVNIRGFALLDTSHSPVPIRGPPHL